MKLQYPYVSDIRSHGWPVFHSLQDVPMRLLPHTLEQRKEQLDGLLRQADAWESSGFFGNAAYWRREARIYYLDAYRMSVELNLSEEDEDLEEEIQQLIMGRECNGSTQPSHG